VQVSPNADAQASKACTPRSSSTSGAKNRSSEYISPNVLVFSRARENTNYLQQIFMSSAPNKGMVFQAEDMDFTPDN
jgi:hypothetical protein